MKSVSATEAKQKLGQLIDSAQSSPVQIVRNGRSIAYLISDIDFNRNEATKREWIELQLVKAKQEAKAGDEIAAEAVYEKVRQALGQ